MSLFRKKTVKDPSYFDEYFRLLCDKIACERPSLFPEYKRPDKPSTTPKSEAKYSIAREEATPQNAFNTKLNENNPPPEKPPLTEAEQAVTEDEKAFQVLTVRGMPIEKALIHLFRNEPTFVEAVRRIIIDKDLKNSDVYHAVHMDRRLFSKIMADTHYKPARDTVILLCIALKVDKFQAVSLLAKCGYAFNYGSRRDVIIVYFIENRIFEMNVINEILFRFGEEPLK